MVGREEFYQQPADINVNDFRVCNNFGGSAFRDWCYLMKYKGIFIGFHNSKWCVLISSDPKAEWKRGCQCPASVGSSLPRSTSAKFIDFDELPSEGKKLAWKWLQEAIALARKMIREEKERQEEERKRKEEEKRRIYVETVLKPWMAAACEEFMSEATELRTDKE